jgi:large repetitive protein
MMLANLTRVCAATLVAVLSVACAYHNPEAPSSTPPISTTAPFTLTLGAAVGVGAAIVTAKVQNVNGAALSGVVVGFSTDAGTLSPASATTDEKGNAVTTVATTGSAKITATAGSLTTAMLVTSQPVVPAPSPTPPSQPPPTSPLGPLSMTISTDSVVVGNSTIFTANILNASGTFNMTWDYGDGASGTGTSSTTAHTYAAAGTYHATAILRDDTGRSTSASTNAVVTPVPVVPPPPPPPPLLSVAVAASATSVTAGGTSTITATATASNGAAAATSYTFDCNSDGTAEANAIGVNTFVCTFPIAGSSTVTVTASNGAQTGTGTVIVAVAAAAAPTLTVNCNTGVKVSVPANPTSCNVSATVNGAVVSGARVQSVTWNFGDNTPTVTDFAGNVSPNHQYAVANTYTVHATATITGVAGPVTGSTTTTIAP